MNTHHSIGEQRLLRLLKGPELGPAADVLPESFSAATAGINWTNVAVLGLGVILTIGAFRFAYRKLVQGQ